MDAQNLWRVRRGLFIFVFLIALIVPSYMLVDDGEIFLLMFSWGPIYLYEFYSPSVSLMQVLYRIFNFIVTTFLPSIILVMGIVGTKLTKRNVSGREKVSRTARITTQIAVTALLFPAISAAFSFIMQGFSMGLYQILNPGSHYSYISISISALCILPIAIFLAYISYDFPRFHAWDFTQDGPLAIERRSEEIKSPSL